MTGWGRTQTLHTHARAYKRCLVCFYHAAHMLQHLTWHLLIHLVMSLLHSPKSFLNLLGWMVQSVVKKGLKLLVSQLMNVVYCRGFRTNFLLSPLSLTVVEFTVRLLHCATEGTVDCHISCVLQLVFPSNVVHVMLSQFASGLGLVWMPERDWQSTTADIVRSFKCFHFHNAWDCYCGFNRCWFYYCHLLVCLSY
jgi:hypothetical protein